MNVLILQTKGWRRAALLLLCAILLSGCTAKTTSPTSSSFGADGTSSSSDALLHSFEEHSPSNSHVFPSPSSPAYSPSWTPSDPPTASIVPSVPTVDPSFSADPSLPSTSVEEDVTVGSYLGAVQEKGSAKNDLSYLFLVNGEECSFRLLQTQDYHLQNKLKIGYRYALTVKEELIVDLAAEDHTPALPTLSPISVAPGERTLKNLLSTALLPIGNTLYVYGGGWNWQDDGGSPEASTIGVSPYWSDFFSKQDASYSYKLPNGQAQTVYYPQDGINHYYFAGLDCSGYLGWVVYNTLHSENGKEDFVVSSTDFAKNLQKKGLGSLSTAFDTLSPGDVVSIKGHVWLCIGRCGDGSIVIAHSTPSLSREGQGGGGAQLSAIGKDKECEAYLLADHYMKSYFPKWYERYAPLLCSPDKYTDFSSENTTRFSFDLSIGGALRDPEGISDMDAAKILSLLFEE